MASLNKQNSLLMILGGLMSVSLSALAAPLDALLTVAETQRAGDSHLELSVDAVNSTLDIFKLRASDPVYAGSSVGDYTGGHLLADYAVSNQLAIKAGYWLRQLTYGADTERIQSWQLATQYRLSKDEAPITFAIQTAAWGNSSTQLSKSTPTSMMGLTVDKIQVNQLQDFQLELNGIASGNWTQRLRWSSFAGIGNSRVSTGNLLLDAYGCQISLNQSGQGTVLNKCSSGLVALYIPPSLMPVLNYQDKYVQLGGSLVWHSAPWEVRGGYQYQIHQRESVDAQIQSQGGKTYQSNHIFIADLQYEFLKNQAIFLRGQLMSNQFLGEIPFAYNSVTASKFDRSYGLVSVGVRLGF